MPWQTSRNNGMMIFKSNFFFKRKKSSCGVKRGYHRKNSLELLNKNNDKVGRLLIIEIITENENYWLINLCNANMEFEQVSTSSDAAVCCKN